MVMVMVMMMTRQNTKQTNAGLKKNTLPEGVICIKALHINMMRRGRVGWNVKAVRYCLARVNLFSNKLILISSRPCLTWGSGHSSIDFTFRRDQSLRQTDRQTDRAVSSLVPDGWNKQSSGLRT